MIGKKLSKETLERFSISYNQARALGITDEDLKYIYEVGEDKFRISIRDGKERITKIVYGLTNAINVKWQMVHEIEMNRLSQGSRNGVDKNKYRQLTVIDGFDLFFSYRKSLVNKGKIERTTYEKDVGIYESRYIQNCELLNKRVINIHEEEAQDIVADMLKDNHNENYEVELDRRKAIEKGIQKLNHHDILLIMGKGHEDVIIVKDKKIPFNDVEVVREILEEKKALS